MCINNSYCQLRLLKDVVVYIEIFIRVIVMVERTIRVGIVERITYR